MNPLSLKSVPGRRGFTLMELAIVLGVASLVVGAIWVAVDTVVQRARINAAVQQGLAILQNMRDHYDKVQGTVGTHTAWLEITDADALNLIPAEMRANPNVAGGVLHHAMASRTTSTVSLWTKGTYTDAGGIAHPTEMGFHFTGITPTQCIEFFAKFPVLAPEIGVYAIGGPINNPALAIDPRTTSLPLSTIQTVCEGLEADGTSRVRVSALLRN